MSQEQQGSNFEMALQYLTEIAGTYAQTLDRVAQAPFIAHVNQCVAAIKDGRPTPPTPPAPRKGSKNEE